MKYKVDVFKGYLDRDTSLEYSEYTEVTDYVLSDRSLFIEQEGLKTTLGLATGYEIKIYEQND